MYDRKKARQLGLTVHCTAPLETPVTVSGTYKCVAGHAHQVQWQSRTVRVSETGYDWAFLAALDAADDAAITVADPETAAYWTQYNAVLTARGYEAVCLPPLTHDRTYPD